MNKHIKTFLIGLVPIIGLIVIVGILYVGYFYHPIYYILGAGLIILFIYGLGGAIEGINKELTYPKHYPTYPSDDDE